MATGGRKWQLIGAFTVTACLAGVAASRAQFLSYNNRTPGVNALLEGQWQSCRESDGKYGERIYDGKWPGLGPFELHMGPYHEFALYRGIQDDHRAHDSADNLLKPFKLEVVANRASRSWDAAGLHLEVNLGGGSRDDCESWFVSLKRSTTTSSH